MMAPLRSQELIIVDTKMRCLWKAPDSKNMMKIKIVAIVKMLDFQFRPHFGRNVKNTFTLKG